MEWPEDKIIEVLDENVKLPGTLNDHEISIQLAHSIRKNNMVTLGRSQSTSVDIKQKFHFLKHQTTKHMSS